MRDKYSSPQVPLLWFVYYLMILMMLLMPSAVAGDEPDAASVENKVAKLIEEMRTRQGMSINNWWSDVARFRELVHPEHYDEGAKALVHQIAVSENGQMKLALTWLPRAALLWPSHLAAGAAPLLEADDSKVHDAASFLLRMLEQEALGRTPIFELHEDYFYDLEGSRPPDVFVDRLYNRSALASLELFTGFYGDPRRDPEGMTLRPTADRLRKTFEYHLWMMEEGDVDTGESLEHQSKAKGALEGLAGLDRWWADIFVAEAMANFKDLRYPEIARELDREDDLVERRLEWLRRVEERERE